MTDETSPRLPRYQELPTALPEYRHAWGVFGAGDELGRLNLRSGASVLAAAQEIRRGAVFNLCLPLDLPSPPWARNRRPYEHHVVSHNRNEQDDYLDAFYPQVSTQWDGFRHVRAAALGFYGG